MKKLLIVSLLFCVVQGLSQEMLQGEMAMDTSFLGFYLTNTDNLDHFFSPIKTTLSEHIDSPEPTKGERPEVQNHYKELYVLLEESSDRLAQMGIVFRVYDDRVSFLYDIPAQEGLPESIVIEQEVTDYKLTGDHECCWISGGLDKEDCTISKFSEIDMEERTAIKTPLIIRNPDSLWLIINPVAYEGDASMNLWIDKESLTLYSVIGNSENIEIRRRLPFQSPWRTIHIRHSEGPLFRSN